MNLLIATPISPPEIGGPATYTRGLCTHLKGHRLTLITFTPKPRYPKGVKVISLPQYRFPFGSIIRQSRLFFTLFAQSRRNDLVYSQGPLVVGFAASIAAKLTKTPLILKFVGDIPWETARTQSLTHLNLADFYRQSQSIHTRILVLFQRLSFTLASQIIVPSKFLQEFLIANHQVPRSKITVIPNPVEVQPTPHKCQPYQLVFVGRLVPWKNVDQIIQAVHLARQKHPWKLIIIGSGPELNQLKLLVQQLNASWVTFLGSESATNTLARVGESQKLILYSDYEGLSHTLIEAMLLKTPIIASDIPANREVTHDQAQFAPLNNIQALATAINQPGSSTDSAYRYALTHYSWDHHLRLLEKLFAHERSYS